METNKPITMMRMKGHYGYISSDFKWFIRHEGTVTYWYACELDENGYTEEHTKQYFRSYQEAKAYVLEQSANQI